MEVVVFTTANCPKCRQTLKMAASQLRKASPPFSLLTRELDSQAAVKYGIDRAPSVLVLSGGVETGRKAGEPTLQEFLQLIGK